MLQLRHFSVGPRDNLSIFKILLPLASDIDFRGTNEDPHAVSALLKMYLRQRI